MGIIAALVIVATFGTSLLVREGGDGGDDFYIIRKLNPKSTCTFCKVI